MKPLRLLPVLGAAAFTLLVGQITDQTTGQPLAGVQVSVASGRATLRATTDTHGRFELRVLPGSRTLRYSSDDVPPQSMSLRVHGSRERVQIVACSTTLDYHCPGASGGGG